jgi:hypothetical protein
MNEAFSCGNRIAQARWMQLVQDQPDTDPVYVINPSNSAYGNNVALTGAVLHAVSCGGSSFNLAKAGITASKRLHHSRAIDHDTPLGSGPQCLADKDRLTMTGTPFHRTVANINYPPPTKPGAAERRYSALCTGSR